MSDEKKFREEQIRIYAETYARNLIMYGVDVRDKLETAIQTSYALNQAYNRGRQDECNRRWIPCEERLPRRNEDVLVYRPKMAMPFFVDRYEGYYGEDDNEWYEGWAYSTNCEVIAWQPLPQPYKKEGAE